MRKLTLLATTAMAAMALMAAAAPAAHADREFLVVNPVSGAYCDPCYDTGYAGDMDFENTSTGAYSGTCDVEFDVRMEADGAFETYNTQTNSCSSGSGVFPCDDSWPGQVRLPDTGPGEIDLEICLENPFTAQQTNHDITLTVLGNPRRWVQATEDNHNSYTIVDAYFEDGYAADNVYTELQ